jgi:hypothetical protein
MATRKNGPRSKRAAQSSDTNTLGPGFYASAFGEGQSAGVDSGQAAGLRDEIKLLRLKIREVTMLSSGNDDLDKAIDVLGALALASTKLAKLLRSQKELDEDTGNAVAEISEALKEVVKEFNLR